jgi:hypothetical protein
MGTTIISGYIGISKFPQMSMHPFYRALVVET